MLAKAVRPSTRLKKVPKARVKKKPKVVPVSRLKSSLDAIFSTYIRTKYGKTCYTCGGTGTLQCGHFISRSYLATRWDENNCRPCCVGCNIFGHGNLLEFEERLKLELGDEYVEAMKKKRKILFKPTRVWYNERIQYYKNEVEIIKQSG